MRKIGKMQIEVLPTVFDQKPPEFVYRDWTDATTRVVSGPCGKGRFPGRYFATREEARRYWEERSRIYEEQIISGRWIYRVRRDA